MTETCIAYTVSGPCGAERVKLASDSNKSPIISIKVDKRYCMAHGLMPDWRDPLGRYYSLDSQDRSDSGYWLR